MNDEWEEKEWIDIIKSKAEERAGERERDREKERRSQLSDTFEIMSLACNKKAVSETRSFNWI